MCVNLGQSLLLCNARAHPGGLGPISKAQVSACASNRVIPLAPADVIDAHQPPGLQSFARYSVCEEFGIQGSDCSGCRPGDERVYRSGCRPGGERAYGSGLTLECCRARSEIGIQ